MTIKEFWEDDPELFWAYRFSFIEKEKREQEKINYTSWLNGLYVYQAVSVSIGNAFGNKNEYPNKPFDLSKTEEEVNNEKQKALVEQLKGRFKKVKEIYKKNNDVAPKK